jgi:hypothetical protein
VVKSRKRIDDAAKLVFHCRSFREVAVAPGYTTLCANVHHTLVSVCGATRGDFERNDGTLDDILQFPHVAWPLVLLKSIPVVVRHTRLIGKLLEELG